MEAEEITFVTEALIEPFCLDDCLYGVGEGEVDHAHPRRAVRVLLVVVQQQRGGVEVEHLLRLEDAHKLVELGENDAYQLLV